MCIIHHHSCEMLFLSYVLLDSGLEVLAVQRVSKAQAWQRAGRAGREDSGSCYRLYTENEFDNLANMTVPEIQRYSVVEMAQSFC